MSAFSDEEFRRCVDRLPVGAMLVDGDGTVLTANRPARECFPADVPDPIGQPFFRCLDVTSGEQARQTLERVVRHGQPAESDARLWNESGDSLRQMLIFAPCCDASGACRGATILLYDVSRRLAEEQQGSRATRMASLGAMAGGLAHHFNNMFGGIITAIDFALHASDPTRKDRALKTTADTLARASSLTQSLLTFAEGDRRDTDQADLSEVILQFARQWEPVFAERRLGFDLTVEPVPPRLVNASSLRTALANLAANALDILESGGGKFAISLRGREGRAYIVVEDDGPGIPEDDQERVFDPFFTTKGAGEEADSPHLGMGLAVAHGIIRELGGTMRLESKAGRGTRFEIALPVEPALGRDSSNPPTTE